MARIRSIHPGQWTDEDFVECSPMARLLCLGLRNEADDKGVFMWKPKGLKMRLLPADGADISELLDELVANKQIKAYEIDGVKYGAIRNFRKWQRPKTPNDTHPMPNGLRKYVGLKPSKSESGSETTDDDGDSISETDGQSTNAISETQGKTPEQREEEGGRREEEGDSTTTDSEFVSPTQTNAPPVGGGDLPDDGAGPFEIPDFLRRDDDSVVELRARPNLADQHEPIVPDGGTPAQALVKAFLTARDEAFGKDYQASYPAMAGAAPGDGATARKWLEAGATPELVREVTLEVVGQMKNTGKPLPPRTMSYLNSPIATAIAAEESPLPSGSGGARAARGDGGGVHPDGEANRWHIRVKAFVENDGFWLDSYGPPPTDPDCDCPPEILAEFGYGPKAAKGAAQ